MSYKKIINFGNIAPRNPLAICLNNTIDNKFNAGVLADAFSGQGANNCQSLLAEYCGDNWDGYCEVASQNTSTLYPNIPAGSQPQEMYVPNPPLNLGEQLIRNAAFKRFCIIPGTVQKCELFDPVNPTSPWICHPVNLDDSTIWQDFQAEIKDFSKIDSDPLFFKMLTNPRTCIDILVKIYNRAKETGKLEELMNTNMGKFVNINRRYFN